MIARVLVAGAGGQGVMLLGKILAEAAMREGRYTTWLPSYGAEVRGGTANCMVVISDEPIGSPYIRMADALVLMNGPSLLRFSERRAARGMCVVNSSMTELPARVPAWMIPAPCTQQAAALGNVKVANMVALGCLLARLPLVKPDTVREVMRVMAPPGRNDLVAINEQALAEGLKL
jgi:2-oxoglutarate ferredoxin oxidoreductase subunit gamma